MAQKYIAAVSDALITFDTVSDAVTHAEGCRTARPLVIYEVRAVAVIHPVEPLTNDDVPPPTGGTPVLMRMAA